MTIRLLDIIIAITFYFIGGLIANAVGMYLQYYGQIHIQKLNIKRMTKNAPEVKDTRKKEVK